MTTCNHNYYQNPIRKGRAKYICGKCGKDITVTLVFLQEALEDNK